MKKYMSKQEIFDKIVMHLRTQNDKCMYNGDCRYRGPNNMACAVGCLIPEGIYSKDLEGKNIFHLLSSGHLTAENLGISDDSIDIITQFQYIHDSDPISSWESSFKRLASDFNLQYSKKP